MKLLSKVAVRAGIDGLLHVIVSVLIMLIVQIFSAWWVAVLAAVAMGVTKELIWDLRFGKGQMQVKDLICDAVGILIGSLGFL